MNSINSHSIEALHTTHDAEVINALEKMK